MNLVSIYQGLADENRLRIVHLLACGPLGVKHLQGILGISQVRVSKHLAYLKARGIVAVERNRNWRLYRLPTDPGPDLKAHLDCLNECAQRGAIFQADLVARQAIAGEVERLRSLPPRTERAATVPPPSALPSVAGVGLGSADGIDYID